MGSSLWGRASLLAMSLLLHLTCVLLAGKAALLSQEEGSCCPYIISGVSFQLYWSPYLHLDSVQSVFNSMQWAFRGSRSICRENVNDSNSRSFGEVLPPQQALLIYAVIFVDYSELLSSSPESPR